MADIAHPPEWLILEGVAYRRSDEHPSEPPWLHVNRAAGLSVHQQLQGAVQAFEDFIAEVSAPTGRLRLEKHADGNVLYEAVRQARSTLAAIRAVSRDRLRAADERR